VRRGLLPIALQRCPLGHQCGQAFASAFQPGQFLGQCLLAGFQFGQRHAVLAGQFVQAGKPLLGFGGGIGIELEIVPGLVDECRRFGQLQTCRFGQLRGLGEPGFVRRPFRQGGERLADRRERTVLVAEQGGSASAGLQQGLGLAGPAVAGLQLREAGRVQRLGGEFGPLMAEEIDAVVDIAAGLQFDDVVFDLLPAPRQIADRGKQRAAAAKAVEQGELAFAQQEGLVLVLAVHFDQQATKGGELTEGGRSAVDPGA